MDQLPLEYNSCWRVLAQFPSKQEILGHCKTKLVEGFTNLGNWVCTRFAEFRACKDAFAKGFVLLVKVCYSLSLPLVDYITQEGLSIKPFVA